MQRAMLPVLLSLILLGCRGPAWVHREGAEHPLAGSIHATEEQRAVSEAALLAALADADFVLLGASPGNLDQLRLQARLVTALARRGKPLAAVALEMIDTDQQAVLADAVSRGGPVSLAGLGAALRWEERGWPAYAGYRPILEAAHAAGAEIVAAGLPPATAAAVRAAGPAALPTAFVKRTGLREPLPPLLADELEQRITADHCGDLAPGLAARIADTRRAEDATLAERLATVTGRGRGVLIADLERTRLDWGVPWYLERLRPGARTVSVAFVEVTRAAEMEVEGAAWNYLWFTPAAGPPAQPACRNPGALFELLEAARPLAAAGRLPS